MSTSHLPLPDPEFIARDPNQVVSDMKLQWETLTGKTMYPAQVEFLLTNLVAYRETLLRIGIQEAAKQNLVNFARYPMLDYLGELVGAYRLLPSAATTIIEFFTDVAITSPTIIPKGTEVSGGSLIFATDVEAIIAPNETSVAVTATATTTGTSSNDVLPGTLKSILNFFNPAVGATNLTLSKGGADMESDDRFRERVRLAPSQFSNAGPRGAYEFYVKSVRQDIAYVGLHVPRPGKVRIYPLLETGIPDQKLLLDVYTTLSDESIRPLTDELEVVAPTEVPYTTTIHIKVYRTASVEETLAQVRTVLEAFALTLQSVLGADMVPSQWVAEAHKVPGVYQAYLDQGCMVLGLAGNTGPGDWLHNTGINIIYEGLSPE